MNKDKEFNLKFVGLFIYFNEMGIFLCWGIDFRFFLFEDIMFYFIVF